MKLLSSAELSVMDYLWKCEEEGHPGVSFSMIVQEVGTGRAKQTIESMLRRALDKGYVRDEGTHRRKSYYTTISRAEYICMFAESVMPGSGEKIRGVLER